MARLSARYGTPVVVVTAELVIGLAFGGIAGLALLSYARLVTDEGFDVSALADSLG